jgi:GNAT superfamily N-acetyltransferase
MSRTSSLKLARLGPDDELEVVNLLASRPAANAYLLGQVARGALLQPERMGPLLGWREGGVIVSVAAIGSNLALSDTASDDALAAFAGYARESEQQSRMLRIVVGPDALVARFMTIFGRQTVALERPAQHLLEVDASRLLKDARSVELRPAQPEDFGALVEADLAMVEEELGMNPFAVDPDSYRRGCERRVVEWRSWVVGPLGGPIHFKVEQSSVSPEVVQLAGVYTSPSNRGRGLARQAVGEMCHLLLRDVPRVSLHVNPDNHVALRLYRRLGFRDVGRIRSVWIEF